MINSKTTLVEKQVSKSIMKSGAQKQKMRKEELVEAAKYPKHWKLSFPGPGVQVNESNSVVQLLQSLLALNFWNKPLWETEIFLWDKKKFWNSSTGKKFILPEKDL